MNGLESWGLESPQNPQTGKSALRSEPLHCSPDFPVCGSTEPSSSVNSLNSDGSKLITITLALLTATCLLLTSCIQREPRADLVIINGNEPESLDPAIVTGISEMRVTKALFEGLVRLDAEHAQPAPGLAERWEVSP